MPSKLFKTLDIKDKVVLITGASAGIGTAIAYGFAEQQCKLVLIARRAERLDEIKQKIQKEYKVDIHTHPLDVTNLKQIMELPEKLPSTFKNVDILVNNAGMGMGGGPIDTLDIDEASSAIDVNVKAGLAFMRAFSPGMKKRNAGDIINISSIAAQHYSAGQGVYNATKHALKCLTEVSRNDLQESPIRIIEIRPGYVETEFFSRAEKGDEKKVNEFLEKTSALDPMDIADNCVYAATRPLHVSINTIVIVPKKFKEFNI